MNMTIRAKAGGYRRLESFKATTIIYDFTVEFCKKYVNEYRMCDQMVQAARSGRQNIAEGSQASSTSKKFEIKLTNVARASLEELLLDYEDYLRQHGLPMWNKDSAEARKVRNLVYIKNRSYSSYRPYMSHSQSAANTAICIIHQATYLLNRQLDTLEQQFLETGGFTERLYHARMNAK
jgi:restriction system protein